MDNRTGLEWTAISSIFCSQIFYYYYYFGDSEFNCNEIKISISKQVFELPLLPVVYDDKVKKTSVINNSAESEVTAKVWLRL